ncbi:hypothetical protein OIU76_009514 [Salix suchowensis]|nr:hypothetical protein OIU76_009514 [Salix suchowensis]
MPRRQLFRYEQRDHNLESDHVFFSRHGDSFNCSNFVDIDWLSSSGNSFEEEPFERSSLLTNSPVDSLSSENVVNGIMGETTPSTSEYGSSTKELIKSWHDDKKHPRLDLLEQNAWLIVFEEKAAEESQRTRTELSYSNPANSNVLEEFSDSFVQWAKDKPSRGFDVF